MLIFAFILAAGLGALLRWGFHHTSLPWPTLIVNVLGSFAIGFLFIYLDRFSLHYKSLICIAFLGAFTTYSSFSLDIVRWLDQGALKTAAMYLLASNLVSIGACYVGWMIAKS